VSRTHRVLYEQAHRVAGRAACPSVVIMDGQSVKTTERGGARGFDAHKRLKGRKRHILVDTLGLLIANRVESADTSDRRAGALLLGGLTALFPITGLTWIVERRFEWLGRNRRLTKDHEYRVQTSETMIDLASIRLMLNRIAPA
jgi:putative transposase